MNSNSTTLQSTNLQGTWGGQGISMAVTENGAEISYDCARGSISEKIVLDGQGHFSAHGRHVREHPGPIRVGEDQEGKAANYRGNVRGDTMNLTVTLSDSDDTFGPFTLTKGNRGRVRRCG